MELTGNVVLLIGVVFVISGVVGIFKLNNFFARILVTAKIDTVGVISIIIGIAMKHGMSFFSLKLTLLLGIMLITNPVSAHIMSRCAYLSGYNPEGVNIGNDSNGGKA